MKKYTFAISVLMVLVASQAFGASYEITGATKSNGWPNFGEDPIQKVTVTENGITTDVTEGFSLDTLTSEDIVVVKNFGNITATLVDVKDFTFQANSNAGTRFSFNGKDQTIKAQQITFKTNGGSTAINFSYNGNGTLTLQGNIKSNAPDINYGQHNDMSISGGIAFRAYAENVTTTQNFGEIWVLFAQKNAGLRNLDFGKDTIVNVDTIDVMANEEDYEGSTRKSNIKIDGTLNLGAFAYNFAQIDSIVTIEHNGTLSVKDSALNFTNAKTSSKGTLNYVIGKNAVFNTLKDAGITLAKDVVISAADAETPSGFTVKGGGTLNIASSLAEIKGDVVVEKGSTLNVSDNSIGGANKISLEVAGKEDYAKLTGLTSTVDNIYFNVTSELTDSITLSLKDVFGTELEWDASKFSSNWSGIEVSGGNLILSVPEPSTYAAILGALALGVAVYRRRK